MAENVSFWVVMRELYYTYEHEYRNLEELCIKKICENLKTVFHVRYLNLPLIMEEKIKKEFHRFKWYKFVELNTSSVADENFSFREQFAEFTPEKMGYLLKCTPEYHHQYAFIPEDEFYVKIEYYYVSEELRYCFYCKNLIETEDDVKRDFKTFLQYLPGPARYLPRQRNYQTFIYIKDDKLWCANCVVRPLFSFNNNRKDLSIYTCNVWLWLCSHSHNTKK